MSIIIISILLVVIFCYANDARMSKLAWSMAERRVTARDEQIRVLELQLRAHLPPAEIAELEEEEAELDALMKKYEKGAF